MIKYNIGWGLTNSCNMHCDFCYSKQTRKDINELSINEWKKFIDDNYEYIETINYGTGENTLKDDFFEFVYYVRKKYPNITQSLTTNGYLYEKVKNNKKLYNMYKESIDEVDVSLDFGNEQRHNKFRGNNNTYNWAIKTLNMLNSDSKKATIVSVGFEDTMTKENIDSLFKIAKKYNAMLRINIYRPVNNIDSVNKRYLLSYKTLVNMLEYMMENYSVVSLNDVLFGNIYSDDVIKENTGKDSIRILPNGDICPSTYLINDKYRNIYNIKEPKVLKKIKFPKFNNPPIPKECMNKNCSIIDKCRGGVFDRRLLWYGTFDKPDPYCPLINNDIVEKKKIKIKKIKRVSVHDGYLPTMFFKNKEE